MKIPTRCIVFGIFLTVVLISTALAQAPAQETEKKPNVIVLKLDDVTKASPNFTRILDFLEARNIKSSAGIICASLEGNKTAYSNWIKERNERGMVEFWCHGLDHKRWKDADGKDLMEFKGTPYDQQKQHFERCQELAREKLGFPFHTFGAPFNATDETTLKVMSEDPEMKVFLYGNPAQASLVPNIMIMERTQMNIENPLFVPNAQRVEHDLRIMGPKREYFVIQGHPDQWDETRIAEFGRMIDYLCSQGVIFTTPYDFYLYKQDPAQHPLPAPSVPGAPIETKALPPTPGVAPAASKSPPDSSGNNLLSNGDFANGMAGWSLFVPPEAQGGEPKFDLTSEEPREGGQCAVMSCTSPVRFAIVNYVQGMKFAAGDRYRVSGWIRAGKGFEPENRTPGFIVRVSMFAGEGTTQNARDGLFYLGLNNQAVRGPDVSIFNGQGVPETWTKVEGVFEVAPDTVRLNVCAFIWKGTGRLYVDDFRLESVDKSTPLSAEGNKL